MNRKTNIRFNYFILQLKRSFIACYRMMGSVIVMIALSIMLAWGISRSFESVKMVEKVTLALVIPQMDEDTEVILDMVSQMRSIEGVCKFVYMDEKEAFEKLEKKEIEAAIVLPENFYDNVNEGTNTPLVISFASNVDLETSVFKELLFDGVSFVRIAQAAMYAATDLGKDYELTMSYHKTYDYLAEFYLWHILQRSEAYVDQILSPTGPVNTTQYYIVVGVFVFLLLGSLVFGFLYKQEEQMLYKKLRLIGVSSTLVAVSRALIMSLFAYISMALVWMIGVVYTGVKGNNLFDSIPIALLAMLPIALAMGAFTNFFYSIAKNQTQGMIINLTVNIAMLVCAGGVMPMSYFPREVREIGSFLPLRYWMLDLQDIFFCGGAGKWIWISLIITAVGWVGATVITEHKR